MFPLRSQPDPYNYPMPQRADLMSLSVIDPHKDGEKTHAKRFNTGRGFNQALKTSDIEGKLLDSLWTTFVFGLAVLEFVLLDFRCPAKTVRIEVIQ